MTYHIEKLFPKALDDLFGLDQSAGVKTYPPYNIIKESEEVSVLELAVAGFSDDELEVTIDGKELFIRGEKTEMTDAETIYLHKGIATRKFERKFVLGSNARVDEKSGISLKNGILLIKVVNVLPDEAKPKQLKIISY